jgi:hypothetical protein
VRSAGSLIRADGPGKAHRWQTTDTRGPKFLRALEAGGLILAELAARECGQLSLDETPAVTIDDAVMVAGCLAALGAPGHETADEFRAMQADPGKTLRVVSWRC